MRPGGLAALTLCLGFAAHPAPVANDPPAPVEQGMYRSPTWEPAIGRRARWVEGSVIVAMCAYFVFGFFNVVRG